MNKKNSAQEEAKVHPVQYLKAEDGHNVAKIIYKSDTLYRSTESYHNIGDMEGNLKTTAKSIIAHFGDEFLQECVNYMKAKN